MKKILVLSVSSLLLLSSCGTYTEQGAYTGATFGSIIGSAIGGIAGGPRGSDIGTLIGLAGGAIAGAAVGQAADNAQQQRYEDYQRNRQQRQGSQRSYDDAYYGGYDQSNSGDDRLYGFDEHFSSTAASATPDIEIRNPQIFDAGSDGVIGRGGQARVVFEVFNNSTKPVYRVQPSVTEITGNKHIRVSENVLVECIMPGKGIRYTAVVRADNRLKDGQAVIRIGVLHNNLEISSQTQEFVLQTSKR